MTTTTYPDVLIRSTTGPTPRHWLVKTGQLFVTIGKHWERRQAEKVLEALPANLRKDIGWPTIDQNTATQ